VKTAFLLGALLLTVVACTAAKESEPQPQYGVQPSQRTPLSELDALEHDLLVSEQRLDQQLSRRSDALAHGSAQPSTPAATAAPPPPPPAPGGPKEEPPPAQAPPEPAPTTDAPKAGDSSADQSSVGAPCDLACRALASMRRSSARICELAGPDDERCARARSRVTAAEDRIRRARCECVG
jgi:hypothetical protein